MDEIVQEEPIQVGAGRSPTIGELTKALAAAQGTLQGASKSGRNPHFNSRYADLSSVWEACREPLATHGLAVIQLPERRDGDVAVTTILSHVSGEWIGSRLSTAIARQDAQSVGSAITYLRRYALAAMVGVAPEDDDGEAAVGRTESRPAPLQPPRRVTEESAAPIAVASRTASAPTPAATAPESREDGNGEPIISEAERQDLYKLLNLRGKKHGEFKAWLLGQGIASGVKVPRRLLPAARAWAEGEADEPGASG